MLKILLIFAFVNAINGTCFHATGGIGEYHKECSSSIGKDVTSELARSNISYNLYAFQRNGSLLRSLQLLVGLS